MIGYIILVLRGGSWRCNPDLLRAAFRNNFILDNRYHRLGFRLVVRIEDE